MNRAFRRKPERFLYSHKANIKYPNLMLPSISGNFEASNLDSVLDSINGGS
jgi:hypothetical protein